jgi:hypothetical protein
VSDPRLERWLELSRAFLRLTPVERLGAFAALCDERARLEQSLREAPAPGIPRELAEELQRTEGELLHVLAAQRDELEQRIAALRGARHAASGYAPATFTHAAFVSRSV